MTTGWCLDGHHTTCRREFTSRQTEQTYRCGCSCHPHSPASAHPADQAQHRRRA